MGLITFFRQHFPEAFTQSSQYWGVDLSVTYGTTTLLPLTAGVLYLEFFLHKLLILMQVLWIPVQL